MPFLDYVDLKNVYCRLYTEYIHLQTYKFSVLLWFLQALQPAQGFLETKWKGFFFIIIYCFNSFFGGRGGQPCSLGSYL